MKSKTPFLDFYEYYMYSGKIPDCGLCNSLDDLNPLSLFAPDTTEIPNIDIREGYWAYNGENELDTSVAQDVRAYTFTPLRQTIVLFCACINNELKY